MNFCAIEEVLSVAATGSMISAVTNDLASAEGKEEYLLIFRKASAIGRDQRQQLTLQGLGLKRNRSLRIVRFNLATWGQVRRIPHLVDYRLIDESIARRVVKHVPAVRVSRDIADLLEAPASVSPFKRPLTSRQLPKLFSDIERDIESGRSPVIIAALDRIGKVLKEVEWTRAVVPRSLASSCLALVPSKNTEVGVAAARAVDVFRRGTGSIESISASLTHEFASFGVDIAITATLSKAATEIGVPVSLSVTLARSFLIQAIGITVQLEPLYVDCNDEYKVLVSGSGFTIENDNYGEVRLGQTGGNVVEFLLRPTTPGEHSVSIDVFYQATVITRNTVSFIVRPENN